MILRLTFFACRKSGIIHHAKSSILSDIDNSTLVLVSLVGSVKTSINYLPKQTWQTHTAIYCDEQVVTFDYANSFIGSVYRRGECPQQIIAIKPKMSNERLSIQQGLFLMPTDISVPFKYNLDNYLPGAGFNRTDDYFNPIEFSKFVEYSHDKRYKAHNDNILMFKITI